MHFWAKSSDIATSDILSTIRIGDNYKSPSPVNVSRWKTSTASCRTHRNSKARMLPLLFLVGLVSATNIIKDGTKELLLVQALWRHGDRSPTKTYPNDKYQEPYWQFGGGGFGQLSPTGMQQHVNLGKMLRDRYIDTTYPGYLSSTYNSKEVYYRSTDKNRTIISAMSNIMGMWSQPNYGNTPNLDYPNSTFWPMGFVPIPIHTVPYDTDYLGNADAVCARQPLLWEMAKSSPELQAFQNSSEVLSVMKVMNANCGYPVDIDNLWVITDAYLIENIHAGPTDMHQKNAWYTEEVNNQAVDVNDQVEVYQNGVFNGTLMMNGLDIGLEIQKIRGGSMTNDIEMHMNIKLDCMAKNKTDGECAWISNLKYYVYSAHDTTIYAFFSCFGIQSKAVQPRGYPHYSAATLIELWYDHKDNQPYFKMLYHDEDGKPFYPITSDIDGCDGDYCKLSVFHDVSVKVTPDQPMDQWCNVDPTVPQSTVGTTANPTDPADTQSSTVLTFLTGVVFTIFANRWV